MMVVIATFLEIAAMSANSFVCLGFFFVCSCVEVEEDKAAEIDLYHCPNCQVTHGPSVSE